MSMTTTAVTAFLILLSGKLFNNGHLPSLCFLSWPFHLSKLRMFSFKSLQGKPYLSLNLAKNIVSLNYKFHFSNHSNLIIFFNFLAFIKYCADPIQSG